MTKPSYEELEQGVEKLKKELHERLRVEKALRDRERSARAIMDHAVQFIGALSTDGILLDLNQTSREFIGAKRSELIGKPFWETAWWTHSPELQEKLRNGIRAAARGEFVRFESNHVGVGGKEMIADVTINPVKDQTGKVILLIPEARDVTEQKKAERALRQSENTAQALLNAAIEATVLTDADGTVLAANEVVSRQFRRPKHEIVGKNLFELLPEALAASRKPRFMEAVQGAKRLRFEDEHKGKFYDHSVYPILNEYGTVNMVAAFTYDITVYKQAQARLQERTASLIEAEDKYRSLVENVPLVVYRLSAKGDLVFVNHFVEEILGYTPEEFYRDPDLWDKTVFRAARAKSKALREKCLLMGKEVVSEYRVMNKKGHTLHVMDHAIPFWSEPGVIARVDGIIMDVSRRVRLQEKLVRAEGHKTITEVSARLAHEIRNPLMSAGSFARRLLSSMAPDDPN
nr:PAS domain S-box protein [Desulfobacterales bacterium]